MKDNVTNIEFLKNFEDVCKSRGIAPSTALIKAGLSNSLYTKWRKNPEAVPNLETLIVIADFLHVSIDRLAGREEDNRVNINAYPGLSRLVNIWPTLGPNTTAQIMSYVDFITRREDNQTK